MPTPLKARCMSCKVNRTLKEYKRKTVVKNGRKYEFVVGKCPKCLGKIYRTVGSSDKAKRRTVTKTSTPRVKKRKVSRA